MEQAARPGRPLDLLVTSSGGGRGRGRITRRLPRLRADAPGGPYSSLLSYRVGGRPCVLAAFPRRSGRAPVRGDPVSLRRAPASGPLVHDLCAGTPDGTWRAFAVLTVSSPPPLGQEESAQFDIHRHGVEGMTPGRTLAATRRAAYRGPRAGRPERGRS
ncbi:hypothetical protein BM536_002445 [Streptomyces phaeoluteigriseus]|uniref:Phosphodiesterase n=1 Tax=Streptomyces phaeoluteigriseus TaxID=114686 RepID=A0A1V6MZ71_9ACTN|nr:hypothetical protein [Streptomyces phaeoluteigriseus]OQD57606.1 hypothetical protein BM536_002445 [Streptomyces phaeoluteigriseus]